MSAVIGSKTSSLAFRVVLYFARNPDEELTSDDISNKWSELGATNISARLRKYRADGILNCTASPDRLRNGATELTWSAGPALLDMLR